MNPALEARLVQQLDLAVPGWRDITNERDPRNLFIHVVYKAAEFWETSEALDFCIQEVELFDGYICFGGVNRLVYRSEGGFTASRSHCTERFLAEYDRIKAGN